MISYTYGDLLNYVSNVIPRIAESDKAAFICNQAIYEIWKKYDFRETLVTLPPFYLIPGEQDHGAPAVAVPADFLSLRQAYLVQFNSYPVFRVPLTVMKDLTLTFQVALPGQIGYEPEKAAFRVYPRVPQNIGAPLWCIQGVYKNRPPKVLSSALASTYLPFDDLYFFNLVEVAKWAGWQASGDPRAGGLQSNNQGNATFTGQYAVAMNAIDRMAMEEGLDLNDVAIAPSEPLAVTFQNAGGVYGPLSRLYGW